MDSTSTRRTWILRGVVALLVIVGLVALARLLPVAQWVEWLRGEVEERGFAGVLWFGLAYFLAALLFVPGSALTLVAGAVFGLALGTALVWIAATLAAAVAFLLARHLARAKVERLAERYPRFRAVDEAIAKGGWRIVALLRLSPVIPFSAGNYLYGLTQVRFVPYVLASCVAMLPGTFLYVYLGHVGGAGLQALGAEQPTAGGVWKTVLLVLGLVATIVVMVYVTRQARAALREREQPRS